ncbi:hypothetical protein EfmAA290_12370 [Enterococcus faecium]|nr:hypothetical protein EfmAA290_12370 [Enterococcus faecium]
MLSAVDVLFELSVDELEEVVLFAEQPAANSNAAAKLILKITLFFYSWKREKDHRQVLIDEASAWLDQDASNQVFFLVPNYSKFEQEFTLCLL